MAVTAIAAVMVTTTAATPTITIMRRKKSEAGVTLTKAPGDYGSPGFFPEKVCYFYRLQFRFNYP